MKKCEMCRLGVAANPGFKVLAGDEVECDEALARDPGQEQAMVASNADPIDVGELFDSACVAPYGGIIHGKRCNGFHGVGCSAAGKALAGIAELADTCF